MNPGPRDPKRPGPGAGPGPRESLLVCWARAQGLVGRAPYIGVYNPDLAPSYGLALHAAFGRTQS